VDNAIDLGRPEPLEAPSSSELEAEAAYERFVWANLPRNFAGHFIHGMLGMTGFRLFNAPTFLPAYLLQLTHSPFLVASGQALQQMGGVVSPVVGATVIEHRKKVLPVSMLMGTLMRLPILGIAIAGWTLAAHPGAEAATILAFLFLMGLFSGAQQVAFQMLLAKVIPIRRRGRLQALRNAAGGAVAACLAWAAGHYLIQGDMFGNGYSTTFLLAFLLTSAGLSAVRLLVREPEPPTLRPKRRLRDRVRDFPGLLAADRDYRYFMVAQTCAVTGRIAAPFYILYAAHVMELSGKNLGLATFAFLGADTVTNIIWGFMGDRWGFRSTFVGALGLWIAATVLLIVAPSMALVLLAFFGLGSAQSGFLMSSQTMVLEFGARDDVPMRLALSSTAQGLMSTLGPLVGGVVAASFGYLPVFWISIAFEAMALCILVTRVREPRFRRAEA